MPKPSGRETNARPFGVKANPPHAHHRRRADVPTMRVRRFRVRRFHGEPERDERRRPARFSCCSFSARSNSNCTSDGKKRSCFAISDQVDFRSQARNSGPCFTGVRRNGVGRRVRCLFPLFFPSSHCLPSRSYRLCFSIVVRHFTTDVFYFRNVENVMRIGLHTEK